MCSSSNESGVAVDVGVDIVDGGGVGIGADSHQSSDGVVGVVGVVEGVGTGAGSHQSAGEVVESPDILESVYLL